MAAFIAFSETPVSPMPGGSISPFCEPDTVTSTPHSSMRKSTEARPETVSTRNSAGCRAASIAFLMSAMLDVTPVDVSLWTTQTALISCFLSSRSRASMAAGSAALRQSDSMNSALSPSFVAICFHSVAKWPVSNIRTLSPGENALISAASHAPVPEAGNRNTWLLVLKMVLMPDSTRRPSCWNSGPR